MPDLFAPKSTETAVAEDKLKDLQKAKMDEERFIQNLFLFLQNMRDSILRSQLEQTSLDLKTPLTALAKDFGYQDLPTALNNAKNIRGQTPLVQALQNQDFSMVKALLDSGAEYDALAREEYDIAIRSERGRGQQIISPPERYTPSPPVKLHTVKEFGLILGIEITSVDGTPSQRAHVGPTYQLMTDTVKDYSQGLSKEPEKGDFKKISDAFTFANKAANYQYSTPEGSPEAGNALSKRIQAGDVTSVPINCTGHAMGLSFVPVEGNSDKVYLVFTNRGEGASPGKHGTQIYEVDKKDITSDFINNVMSGHDKGHSHEQVMEQIHQVTKGEQPVYTLEQKPQKYDNCTVANTRANVHGVLLCQEANRKGGFENVDQETKDKVKQRYKEFTDDMRSKKVQQLDKALEKTPEDPDLKALKKAYMDKPKSKSAVVEKSEESINMRSP
ncbi:Dot/Icm T4SS effector AnkD/LegA15 [Legionella tucsonensis]|uniref:Substrate of the Dot/Icm secretion system n=1 Tax=Legionella tucsonensis TaxID=40335 RepID=A0A0W0ZR11_9GAMM|nr:Dot/Icm T4SS effector AnkD/LegA15 [Legionella tucsonensis]KTD71374.1 substrate of the Dot/Icm secretion system [Legionella tucsonensis]